MLCEDPSCPSFTAGLQSQSAECWWWIGRVRTLRIGLLCWFPHPKAVVIQFWSFKSPRRHLAQQKFYTFLKYGNLKEKKCWEKQIFWFPFCDTMDTASVLLTKRSLCLPLLPLLWIHTTITLALVRSDQTLSQVLDVLGFVHMLSEFILTFPSLLFLFKLLSLYRSFS